VIRLEAILSVLPVRIPTVPIRVPAMRVDADAIEREMHLGPCPSCGEKKRALATCVEYLASPGPDGAEPGLLARLHARYGRGDHSHAKCSCGNVTMQLPEGAYDRFTRDRRSP
jgi:hypothetical protein